MFAIIDELIIKDINISNVAFRLYSLILIRSLKEGFCYESSESLSNSIGISRRGLFRVLDELENGGYIRRESTTRKRKIYPIISATGDTNDPISATGDTKLVSMVTPTSATGGTPKNKKEEEEVKKNIKMVGFVKPSIEEIAEYIIELGITSFDADYFYDHYEANGWRVGKAAMKCWKATLRNWKRNAGDFKRNGSNSAGIGNKTRAAPPPGWVDDGNGNLSQIEDF